MTLEAQSLRLAYGPDRVVIDELDLAVPSGQVTAVIGANGSGKSTLLRALARLLLSGGQRQRAWLALVIAQGTPVLLLDEPTTFLDVAHQLDVLDLVRRLNGDEGRTVVMVLHDLNQACRYADHLVALRAGTIVAAGPPAEVVTEDLVARVFDLESRVVPDPVTGTPLVVPVGRVRDTPHPSTLG
jgi:ABC-type cobalamin/Fe3+-siderophores transport system ATPase subunit